LTVPLARVVAQYQNELPKFFKRYQIQPVWRADRPAKGRFREFYQCDIDSLGSTAPVVEAELLSAVCEVLAQLGFQDFILRLNHRGLLTALLDTAGVPQGQHAEALVALDKLDKIGRDGVEKEFAVRGITEDAARKALTFFTGEPAVPDATLARLSGIVGRHDALANLGAIVNLLAGTDGGKKIRIDPSLARGLSYYTGAIMEVAVPDLAGSLGGGGRYDNLIGMFLGRDVPACGFSLGLERIIVVMTERDMFPERVTGAVDVLVTMWEEPELRADAVALAADLRKSEMRVEVYPEADKLGKQFKYAAERHVKFVAIQGADEKAKQIVQIKDLDSSEQTALPRSEVAAFLANPGP